MGHHPGGVMLEDVAVVHPAPWAVVGQPGDSDAALGGNVDRVFPGQELRRRPVHLDDLEEEAVEMEWVIPLVSLTTSHTWSSPTRTGSAW